jgi:hypothetical protein
MQMYEELAERLQDRDVLILYNGANLHPDFVNLLKILKIYTAGDDPESTEILTKPIAPVFDIHLVNNIACVDMYKGWGLKNVYFWPLGSLTFPEDVIDLDETEIADISRRPLPAVLFCERESSWRKKRLDRLAQAFPQAVFAGRGWSRGYIDWSEISSCYRQAQIGWNIHNSKGPVNFRTYELPAYGVMQICDNKAFLNQIFEVGKEVVGFDSIKECIELTRYYLSHPDEQREIALSGWKRWKRDYTPEKIWEKLVAIVDHHWAKSNSERSFAHSDIINVVSQLHEHKKAKALKRLSSRFRNFISPLYHKVLKPSLVNLRRVVHCLV